MNDRAPPEVSRSRPPSRFQWLGSKTTMLFLCYLVAAISFGGFFEKWAFRDGMSYSAIEMMDGVAKRPFVYRQLMPSTANLVEELVPARLEQRFTDWLAADPHKHNFIYRYFSNATDSTNPRYVLRYYVLFVLCFASYLFGIAALRAVCCEMYPDATSATLAAFTLALVFPMLTTEGGYMYDMTEVLFMALAVLCALRGRLLLLGVIALLATYNKESFVFFILTLYPFLREKFSRRASLAIQGALLALTLSVNLWVKLRYAANPGGFVVNQLGEHVRWLLSPSSYMLFEVNYGAVTTKGLNIVHLIVVAFVVKNAWPYVPRTLKRHGWMALSINLPLFVLFCYRGELRNLSMLFVTFTVLLSVNISRYFQQVYRGHAYSADSELEPLAEQTAPPSVLAEPDRALHLQ
jgi:hypothetical protein